MTQNRTTENNAPEREKKRTIAYILLNNGINACSPIKKEKIKKTKREGVPAAAEKGSAAKRERTKK